MAAVAATLAQTLLTAFQQIVGPTNTTVTLALECQAKALAQGLVVTAAQVSLTADQKTALLTSFVDEAEAGLAGDVASLAKDAPALILAGLQAVVAAGLDIAGLGPLDPVVSAVIADLTATLQSL